jgi:hypothetical protein
MPQLAWTVVIGVGVGWLAGLSASPVIATVLASLLGLAGGVVAAAQGIDKDLRPSSILAGVDARPVAALVLGVALGAPLGILARTYDLFEPSGSDARATIEQSVLFNVTQQECDFVLGELRRSEDAFREALRDSSEELRLLEARISGVDDLQAAVEAICAQD